MSDNYYSVRFHEGKKFLDITACILAEAKKYSFYHTELSFLLAMNIVGNIQNIPTSAEYFYVFNSKGWAVILLKPTFVEVKYIFVRPEYRRTGFFTQLVKKLKGHEKEISVCTRQEIMVKALVKNGFKLNGRSTNGEELRYDLRPENF